MLQIIRCIGGPPFYCRACMIRHAIVHRSWFWQLEHSTRIASRPTRPVLTTEAPSLLHSTHMCIDQNCQGDCGSPTWSASFEAHQPTNMSPLQITHPSLLFRQRKAQLRRPAVMFGNDTDKKSKKISIAELIRVVEARQQHQREAQQKGGGGGGGGGGGDDHPWGRPTVHKEWMEKGC